MDTNQLQAFDMVTRQGSFSKAARALDLSQPAISVRIQALEQTVGGALFVRGGSRLALTELGTSFLPYARQALAVLASGVEIVRQTKQGARGRVSLATLPALTMDFVASAMARFHAGHPQVDLIVHTNHSDQILETLYDGQVKLGLVNWPLELSVRDLPLFARESALVCLSREEPHLSPAIRAFLMVLPEEGRASGCLTGW